MRTRCLTREEKVSIVLIKSPVINLDQYGTEEALVRKGGNHEIR